MLFFFEHFPPMGLAMWCNSVKFTKFDDVGGTNISY